jgi:hypothetical protein
LKIAFLHPKQKIMKQILTAAIFLLAINSASAKIWRLNNNNNGTISPTVKTDFLQTVTLQQAHDSAKVQPGDTIHIEQSNFSYGPLTMNKRLTLIGVGYFLNLNPNTQTNTSFNSPVGAITITNVAAAGSHLLGLRTAIIYAGVSKIKIANCWFDQVQIGSGVATQPTDSISIIGCFSQGLISSAGTTALNTNIGIYNNLIVPGANQGTAITLSQYCSGILKNNIFSSYTVPMAVSNFYVVNNISVSSFPASYNNTFNNCVIEYNIGQNAGHFQTPLGSGNTSNAINNLVSTNYLFVAGTSTDGQFQLQSGSPAKTTGKSGTEMGAFGGDFPYSLSGITNVPNIYQLNIAPIPAGASTMSVTISAKSN